MYKMKNKVIDYVTPTTTCQLIGIDEKSTPQIIKWIGEKRIAGAYKFGNNWAIPIRWIKSECLERGIEFQEIKLQNDEKGVSLKDYTPIREWATKNNVSHSKIHSQMKRGTFDGDYIRFGNAYGIRKEDIK